MMIIKISSLANRVYGELVEPILHKCHLKARYSSAFYSGFSFLIFLFFTSALLTGCGSSKYIQTVPIETIRDHQVHDTLYINNVQYDSIYVSQNRYTDRSKDTVLIRQHDVEYRYKLLRDTIERIKLEVRHDSIPYEVRITEVKQVKHIPPWCKWLSVIGGTAMLLLVIKLSQKLKAFI